MNTPKTTDNGFIQRKKNDNKANENPFQQNIPVKLDANMVKVPSLKVKTELSHQI
jgi:hypothetical protein